MPQLICDPVGDIMGQLSPASLDYAAKQKRTKWEVFLDEMDPVVPWSKLEAMIESHYTRASLTGGIRRLFPLTVMLRIYFLQQWYQLSDPGADGRTDGALMPAP